MNFFSKGVNGANVESLYYRGPKVIGKAKQGCHVRNYFNKTITNTDVLYQAILVQVRNVSIASARKGLSGGNIFKITIKIG